MLSEKKSRKEDKTCWIRSLETIKLEIYGEEMIEKIVKMSGNSGRVYLPVGWVGRRVKFVKLGRAINK